MKVRVQNMTNQNGNTVPNQFEMYTDDGVYFQSYQSVIAYKPYNGPTQLDRTYWAHSATTSKYRNQFLDEGTAETRRKIASGEYILTDLNK